MSSQLTGTEKMSEQAKFMRPKEVCKYLGFSRPTLDRHEARGLLPAGKRLNDRMVVFIRSEIEAYAKDPVAWIEQHGANQ
jgi:predicted DNA-binding transcriptional regulator AlpA